jgi:UDP-N-acetyl-D-mannosaminuronic acid dehydrogenase
LIRTAREVNDAKPQRVVADVVATVRDVDEPRIALLGLAFKPNIDDLRESPAVEIARRVAEALPEAAVLAVEPHVDTLPSALGTLPNVRLTSFDDAVQDADLVAVLVGHDAFLGLRDGRLGVTPTIDTVGLLSV